MAEYGSSNGSYPAKHMERRCCNYSSVGIVPRGSSKKGSHAVSLKTHLLGDDIGCPQQTCFFLSLKVPRLSTSTCHVLSFWCYLATQFLFGRHPLVNRSSYPIFIPWRVQESGLLQPNHEAGPCPLCTCHDLTPVLIRRIDHIWGGWWSKMVTSF